MMFSLGSALVGFFAVGIALWLILFDNSTTETTALVERMSEEAQSNRAKYREMGRSAFIVGYTGESGKALVKELLSSKVFSRIVLMGRRKVEYDEEMLKDVQVDQEIVNFDNLEESADLFKGIDQGFCCLGTTRGKSGSDGFYKVDHDYVMSVAKLAREAGVKHFHLMSSQGANKNAWVLYTKTKGKVEEETKELGFERLTIYRPAVLMCDREERRMGEAVARTVLKPVAWAFPTFITTPIEVLANAMVNAAVFPGPTDKPWELLENKAIHKLAKKTEQK